MIIRKIEDAMIARIKLVNSVANFGNLIKTVDRYSGEFSDENMSLLITRAPFVLVSHTRSVAIDTTRTGTRWTGEFTIVCGATSRRAQTMASRVGGVSSTELGSRQIGELVRDLLVSEMLGLPISPLEPVSIDELYSGQAAGAGGQNFFSVTGLQFRSQYSTTRSSAADPASTGLTEIVATFAAQFDGGTTINDPAENTVTVPLDPSQTGATP